MPSITDYLKSELDKALAKQPDDDARLILLAEQFCHWSVRQRRFWLFGEQPFGTPHPHNGEMTPGDFIIVLGMIDGARVRIERSAPAHA
jgi:hypothetical protein